MRKSLFNAIRTVLLQNLNSSLSISQIAAKINRQKLFLNNDNSGVTPQQVGLEALSVLTDEVEPDFEISLGFIQKGDYFVNGKQLSLKELKRQIKADNFNTPVTSKNNSIAARKIPSLSIDGARSSIKKIKKTVLDDALRASLGDYISSTEAHRSGVSIATLTKWRNSNKIHAYKAKNLWYYSRQDLLQVLKSQ